uniref:KIB1-4 beta-propeller domain-containing protein n=1 Tax=Arundo donax TaxID=35708 RepID=A0A0A8Z4W7_ARUDO
MIFSSNKSCLVFDVFTGIGVSPPLLPVDEYSEINYAALTAPLASPNSHLIVFTAFSNFFWRVGSNLWLKHSPCNGKLNNIVIFKGQVFGMGSDRRLFMVHLMPRIRVQKIPLAWGGNNSMTKWHLSTHWLVACGDLLLLVGCQSCFPRTGDIFEAYRLDMSTKPAKWVKVEELENWAIFISNDERSQALSCMNPERRGGRSNCMYFYDSGRSVAFELGKSLQGVLFMSIGCGSMVQPIWVVPSLFSLCRDS